MALQIINNDPNILPETEVKVDYRFYGYSISRAIEHVILASENNETLLIGNYFDEECSRTGIVGGVYDVAQISASAGTTNLNNRNTYPYISSMFPRTNRQVEAITELLLYYQDIRGLGWTDVALYVETTEYGVDNAEALISVEELNVLAYQQFINSYYIGIDSIMIELEEIKSSGARVLIYIGVPEDWARIIPQAAEIGLVSEEYVWIASDFIVGVPFTEDPESELAQISRGLLANFVYFPDTVQYIKFLDAWTQFGFLEPPLPYTVMAYDMTIAAALALNEIYNMGLLDGQRISAKMFNDVIQDITFDGISGPVSFNGLGERLTPLVMLNFIPETLSWKPIALWFPDAPHLPIDDAVWFSNTTIVPDLDIREAFGYWSCHEGEKGYDETGKTISLHTPDGSDIDDIDSNYHCDQFIDCKNISDESKDCSSNFVIIYFVFGGITILLMLIVVLLALFVLVFGVWLNYQRLRVASPNFLMILLLSIFVGYSSVFAFFGKPHPVACFFQPWLLGLPVISMIAVLSVKNFRVYRIFRFPLKRVKVSDLEVFFLWLCVMIPAVIIVIVWMIVSTPTARMVERNGADHYVCATGGFTKEPGGFVFFGIFVGYSAFVLIVGAFISILARNIPSSFNETKLLTISIYNLGFLAMVIIPVFLVVHPFNPFIAWILRTCAVLYAFTATLFLQFAPMVFHIVLIDRCKKIDRAVVIVATTQ